MAIITITTDFGSAGSFVGAMKGVILSIAPDARIVDITHEIPPRDILAGALALEEAFSFFPAGTIHLAVVDPGVGSSRAPVAIKSRGYHFVGPDNGLFHLCLANENEVEVVRLTNPKYRLPSVSSTFHGRDIFAPAAAHVLAGVPLKALGESAAPLSPLFLPVCVPQQDTLHVPILKADRFGNLITALKHPAFSEWSGGAGVKIDISGQIINSIASTYSDAAPGEPAAYFGSSKRLEIAINQGNAQVHFDNPGKITLHRH